MAGRSAASPLEADVTLPYSSTVMFDVVYVPLGSTPRGSKATVISPALVIGPPEDVIPSPPTTPTLETPPLIVTSACWLPALVTATPEPVKLILLTSPITSEPSSSIATGLPPPPGVPPPPSLQPQGAPGPADVRT